jgi:translocation and assembly module TamB
LSESVSWQRVPRRWLRATALAVLIAAATLGGAAAWLLYTAPGFAWSVARLGQVAGAALVLEEARGTLSGGMTVRRLSYALEDGTKIEARDLALRLSPASLLALAPRVLDLQCAELAITLAPAAGPSTPPDSLALPVAVHVARVRIGRLRVGAPGDAVELANVAFGYSGDGSSHRVYDAAFEFGGTRIAGDASMGAAPPFSIDASVNAAREAAPAGKLATRLRGPLQRIAVTAQVDSTGGRAVIEGMLTPYDPLPLASLRATMTDLDLRAFDAALPRTALDGILDLAPAGAAARHELKGRLEIRNRLAGSWDKGRLPLAALEVAVQTDLARVRLDGHAGLGTAGSFKGEGDIGRDGATLTLRSEALNLAGIHGRLRATRLSGRIDARLDGRKQSVTAELSERDARIALRAEHVAGVVTLHEVRVHARGGEARGNGRIALSGARPFEAEARLIAFNPAAWGDFPAGAVNGRFSAKGSLAPQRSVDAELALEPSRLRDAPLAGNARASLRGERVTAVHADLDWGGNRVSARGAWGGAGDKLAVSVEAPRVAVIDPAWSGRFSGKAEVGGSWQAPGAKFTLSANDLALEGRGRIDALSARGEYTAGPDGPLALAIAVTDAAVQGWHLARASLDIEGTRQTHTMVLRARNKTMDLLARARGGWQPAGGWAGSVQELENRGTHPLALEAPVTIEVAPGRARMSRIMARYAGGRMDAAEFRYENGRITSRGQFNGMRVAALLAAAGLSPDAGGSLQVAGAWTLSGAPGWNGTVSLRRESGDLSLAAQNAMPLGLETLAMDARIVDGRIEFSGLLRAQLASGNIEGSVAPVAGPEGSRIGAASPLQFTSRLEIARLAALTSSPETSLHLDGRLRAALRGGGTLGDPLLSGTVDGDGLGIGLAQEGVNLRNGTLRAELDGRDIHIRSFSLHAGQGTFRAGGTLTRGGSGRAALEWEAERLAVMQRPGRRVTVTGRGKAALEDGKVSLSGQLRADEGEIVLRTGALLVPGDDVVIVGRQQAGAGATRIRQAALDLSFDFGDRFRVVGRGLDTFLAGRIRLQTGVAGELVASGSVQAVRGTYMAFSQRLELERGRLVFEGPVDNPTLDIRAMRKMAQVEAGVEVSGTLRNPVARVVSQPAMSENEALSWLILGHGSSDASGTDLSMLPLAAAALLGQDQGAGTGGVARAFGLDSIGLRSSGGGSSSTGAQFVTFGKRVADNLYVIYEQGFGAAASLLKLEFNLTRRVLLRAETGESSGVGVFYRWAFD